jgi:hypothetical protein
VSTAAATAPPPDIRAAIGHGLNMNYSKAPVPDPDEQVEVVGDAWDKSIKVPLEDDEAQELSDLATTQMIEIDCDLEAAEGVFDSAKSAYKAAVKVHTGLMDTVKVQLREANARVAELSIPVNRVLYWDRSGGIELIVGTAGKWKGFEFGRKAITGVDRQLSADIQTKPAKPTADSLDAIVALLAEHVTLPAQAICDLRGISPAELKHRADYLVAQGRAEWTGGRIGECHDWGIVQDVLAAAPGTVDELMAHELMTRLELKRVSEILHAQEGFAAESDTFGRWRLGADTAASEPTAGYLPDDATADLQLEMWTLLTTMLKSKAKTLDGWTRAFSGDHTFVQGLGEGGVAVLIGEAVRTGAVIEIPPTAKQKARYKTSKRPFLRSGQRQIERLMGATKWTLDELTHELDAGAIRSIDGPLTPDNLSSVIAGAIESKTIKARENPDGVLVMWLA